MKRNIIMIVIILGNSNTNERTVGEGELMMRFYRKRCKLYCTTVLLYVYVHTLYVKVIIYSR